MRRAENPIPDADPPPTPPTPRSERDAARHAGGGEVVKDVPRKGIVEPLHGRGSAQLAVQPHHEGQRPLRVQPAAPEADFRPVALRAWTGGCRCRETVRIGQSAACHEAS
jgi:hypothetical protein